MLVNELIRKLEEQFPSSLQEEYDNTGSQVIFQDETVRGIYICLDADNTVIDDARKNNCNLIISHHPMIFRPVKSINTDDSRSKSIVKLIDGRISLYSMHTNFDKIGFSYLSDFTGFTGGELLIKKGFFNEKDVGFGTIKQLDESIDFISVLKQVKERLNLDYLLYSGDYTAKIKSIAFINGAGGGSIERIINTVHPDCIITGDVGYHNIKYAAENNTCIIDAGHFGTEIIFKKLLAESVYNIISVTGDNIKITVSDIEKNPFKIY